MTYRYKMLLPYDSRNAGVRRRFRADLTQFLHESRFDFLGGHLKTGHRSTLQNRPPRGRGDRDSVFGRRPATSWVAAVSLRVLVLLLLLQYKGRLWECGNLAFWARFPSPLWKPFCGFHRDVISIAVFGRRPTGSRPADIHGMLYVAGLPIVVLEPRRARLFVIGRPVRAAYGRSLLLCRLLSAQVDVDFGAPA